VYGKCGIDMTEGATPCIADNHELTIP
jgi:hypothetical protein